MKKFFRFDNVVGGGETTPSLIMVDSEALTSIRCYTSGGSYYIKKNGSEWLEFKSRTDRDEAFNKISEFILSTNSDKTGITGVTV